jgi:hypothetical protein
MQVGRAAAPAGPLLRQALDEAEVEPALLEATPVERAAGRRAACGRR